MIAAVLEKFSYVAAVGVLISQNRLQPGDSMALGGAVDALLGVLFVAAFLATRKATGGTTPSVHTCS